MTSERISRPHVQAHGAGIGLATTPTTHARIVRGEEAIPSIGAAS